MMKETSVIDFDLTPDPKVLVALTQTPLQPLDALSELIDNAIDSFQAARLQGAPIEYPLIIVEVPGPAEVNRSEGVLRVRDNGPGMTPDLAEKALRAGYSGKSPYGSLGLFGMGFNISTGKLGRTTRFLTARAEDDQALEVTVDLVRMQEQRSYRVPPKLIAKPPEFPNGTIVEVTGWWPEGNANNGFIKKLAGYGRPRIRQELGRRYATILREQNIRILVNGEACYAHEHCVWDRSRSVERRGHGRIPARFDFDEIVGNQTRCTDCTALIQNNDIACPACGSSSLRTLQERVRGWVGIQRFDDQVNFGIDLVRNGRAIRISEQRAFFEFADEFRKTVRDYPYDGPYGRIVGEVHLDHVPVDFLKQDFERSSPEWQRAMSFLRGDSSLQPTQPGADQNVSPVFKLYQGYRKVRTPGTTDMYMGRWDSETGRPQRISRDIEREYLEKFREKLPGYYDDAEWWKLVEQADQQPLAELVNCPHCHAQNLKEQEECQACGHLLIGKPCVSCAKQIPKSAVSCPNCGSSQIPKIVKPWACNVCSQSNVSEDDVCVRCTKPRGTQNPTSLEGLLSASDKADELSLHGCSVLLADGTHTQPLDVSTYISREAIVKTWGGPALPLIAFRGRPFEIFIDKSHPLFRAYRVRPEHLIAAEIAQYLYDQHRGLLTTQAYIGVHAIAHLTWLVLQQGWANTLEDTPERVQRDVRALFDNIRTRVSNVISARGEDLFADLSEAQKKAMVENMMGRGIDITTISTLKTSGEFVLYVDNDTIVDIFRKAPELFFDKNVWTTPYEKISDLPEVVVHEAKERTKTKYFNCLEDAAGFVRYVEPELIITQRARASVEFLMQRMD